jgi:hypothetical protein
MERILNATGSDMPFRSVRFALAVAALLIALECVAGTAEPVRVNVTLNNPAGQSALCTSQALSDGTGAVVKVLCSDGQFVSIGPRAGAPFVGVHGGAFTYYFTPASSIQADAFSGLYQGIGTVTEYRVHSSDDRFIDIWVSF